MSNTLFILLFNDSIAFCRIVTGLVFALSFVSKLRNIPAFAQTISRFRLLPSGFNNIAAFVVLGSELVVVMTMLIGAWLLTWGFILAATVLVAFCLAMSSVLLRNIQTSCNCFGVSEKLVSSDDIVRNLGLIVCSLSGYGVLTLSGETVALSALDWAVSAFAAAIFVAVWLQLSEIIQLFK